ncbi:MAG TPA: LacI family DNA-binding transcriptional regulator [Spirochaetia bacterium]|nr:LacI family DNA-binding transcriptional regulator [Spirochaetia bacterium]
MKRKPVSIAHVAEKAEVSSMTVSRIIRGEPSVKEETRTRVIRVMKDLGYVPSAAAQSLRSRDRLRAGGRRLFALIFGQGTECSVTFFHDIAHGVEQAAAESGLYPIQIALQDDAELRWLRLQTVLSIGGLCGALLVGQFSPEDVRFIRSNVREVVMVDGPAPAGEPVESVEAGNLEGSLMALDYLSGIGCRRIGVITVMSGHYFAHAMEQAADFRRSGSLQIEMVYGCQSSSDAREQVIRLWNAGQRFDGIFTNDDFAIGALKAFRELRVGVPEEVKIVGFDDIQYASFTVPSLTSIRIDKFLLGAEAVRTLALMMHAPERAVGVRKVIKPTLVIRESTGG